MIISSLALAVCFSAYAQDKKQMPTEHRPFAYTNRSGVTADYSSGKIEYNDSLLKVVKAAQKEFEANPSSQQAAEKLIKAKVELFALEKKIEVTSKKHSPRLRARGRQTLKSLAERRK